MFDIDPSEFLVIVVIAVVAIGPKDLPRAMRTAGRLISKVRRISGHMRSGIESMIQEAELEDVDRKRREQKAAVSGDLPEKQGPVTEPVAPSEDTPAPIPAQASQL